MTETSFMDTGDPGALRETRGLKRVLPFGIYGRYYLIMLFPIIVILLVVSIVFIERHFAKVTRQMVQNFLPNLQEIQLQILAAEDIGTVQNSYILSLETHQLSLELPTEDDVPVRDRYSFSDLTGRSIISTLREDVASVKAVDLTDFDEKTVQIYFTTKFGDAKVAVGRRQLSPSNPHQFLVLIATVSFLSVLISVLFLRNQLRPIRRLAKAAEAFGRGESVNLHVSGADEVRSATIAFLDMRNRIERHLLEMTNIMTSISHDLKTPLTRLRLGIEIIEDQTQKQEIIGDIDVMTRMITEIQEFSRKGETESYANVDPVAIARTVTEDFCRMGHDITLTVGRNEDLPVAIRCRPIALRRSLENLVVNATRYASIVTITIGKYESMLEFSVEDNGPGIDPKFYEQVKMPFIRIDKARNLDAGEGVGLGLTITNQVASLHGGYLAFDRSRTLGGLNAIVRIPV